MPVEAPPCRRSRSGGAKSGQLQHHMHYVYRLHSERLLNQEYTGSTNDLKDRLRQHNLGQNISTAPFRPWRLTFYAAFESPATARAFEQYLKTGSGKAFGRKRLWPGNG